MLELHPGNTEIIAIAFEGPDPYAQAGGLGVRMTGLTKALAARGFRVHFFFVGDPARPGVETRDTLTLYRWGQWISQYHPEGVYAAEWDKMVDLENSLPPFVRDHLVWPGVQAGRRFVILTEEWQTAPTAIGLSDLLYGAGVRSEAVIFWNANHRMGLHRIDFPRLGFVATLTTVSRFMRHVLQQYGINPVVIPNGIDAAWFQDIPQSVVHRIQRLFSRPLLVKVGRFDPDKRWIMAVEAVARLKAQGLAPTLVMRGGLEPHGAAVFERARDLGLSVQDVVLEGTPSRDDVLKALEAARPRADLVHLRMFLPTDFLGALYRSADAVLVNSGFEPFGLVGLEVMASRGLAITGGTGEDYARAFVNGLVVDNEDPWRLAELVRFVEKRPELRAQMIRAGAATAKTYLWDRVVEELLSQVTLAFERQNRESGV
ncbi:MAG: glycosyltransferase family 4 protein [Firmicutes bacterium]|nr:glycosyltransferase family 4 protein [Bacillota bacterium]